MSVSLLIENSEKPFLNVRLNNISLDGQVNINSTGSNLYYGHQAGASVTSGIQITIFGNGSGINISNSAGVTILGNASGTGLTMGSKEVIIGSSSGNTITIGSQNTVVGHQADVINGTDSNVTAIGYLAKASDQNCSLGAGTNDFGNAHCLNLGTNATTTSPNSIGIGCGITPTAEVNTSSQYIKLRMNGTDYKLLLA
jgi:hypothetical protein